jgi:signal peptidase I
LNSFQPGDIVLFQPPRLLMDIVEKNGGSISSRDLFVKRIAAVPGDQFTLLNDGTVEINRQIPKERRDMCAAEPLQLLQKYNFRQKQQSMEQQDGMLGDCADVSIDSRVWGTLPMENIVGRPVVRLWPISSIGQLPSLTTQ